VSGICRGVGVGVVSGFACGGVRSGVALVGEVCCVGGGVCCLFNCLVRFCRGVGVEVVNGFACAGVCGSVALVGVVCRGGGGVRCCVVCLCRCFVGGDVSGVTRGGIGVGFGVGEGRDGVCADAGLR
jgi:hypothetical protein